MGDLNFTVFNLKASLFQLVSVLALAEFWKFSLLWANLISIFIGLLLRYSSSALAI